MAREIFPGWLPTQLAKHYGFPLQYNGKGQSIAIISLGGVVDMKELEQDFQSMRVPMPKINMVDVDPQSITQAQNEMPTGETHLDVEVIGAICPQAEISIYRGPNPAGLADATKRAVADKNSVISISWGGTEYAADKGSEMESVLKSAQDAGITVCVAAGDGGSSGARSQTGAAVAAADGKAHANYPATSPYVLACGGTELQLANGQQTEVVWNNSGQGGGATGGGVSELFELPSWQTGAGINIPSANTGKTGRVVPDVAGLAAVGDWKIYGDGREQLMGGTSAVAPLWASFVALANQARAEAGKGPLGFINERLYGLAAQGGCFTDITAGDNKPSADYPGYAAGSGFDACSGWGTPVGAKLFAALTAD